MLAAQLKLITNGNNSYFVWPIKGRKETVCHLMQKASSMEKRLQKETQGCRNCHHMKIRKAQKVREWLSQNEQTQGASEVGTGDTGATYFETYSEISLSNWGQINTNLWYFRSASASFSSTFTIQLGLLTEKCVFLFSLDLLVNLTGERLTI